MSTSKRKRRITILLGAIILMACAGMLLVEAQTRVLRRYLDDVVYDNQNHYLSCDLLPTLFEAEKVVREHQEVIHQIEQVNPGLVGIELGSPCPGKADILFWYGSHRDRLAIEGIIGDETFYGIPYRLQNR